VLRGKLNPKIAIFGHKIPQRDLKAVQAIYDKVESRPERYELNLYTSGEDEEPPAAVPAGAVAGSDGGAAPDAPISPEGSTSQ
jgi:hypothetical protein